MANPAPADSAKRARPAAAKPPAPDRTNMRMVAFVGGLVLALVAGFGLGRAVGPDRTAAPSGTASRGPAAAGHNDGHDHGGISGPNTPTVSDQVSGLALAAGGHTLVPLSGPGSPFSFRIDGPDRRPVTKFATVHDKQMHLIVVRRDLSGYRHVHPTMASDGTWSVDLPLPVPGIYRAFADFAVVAANGAQTAYTLGTDLTVPGAYQPRPLPLPVREATTAGFTVTYEGTPQVGATHPLLFRVFSNGQPVLNLERYLSAFGHLVIVRDGDLGYVHVHPEDQLLQGAVKFWQAAPSPGRYRMFFDFQGNGVVYTAEFTLVVP